MNSIQSGLGDRFEWTNMVISNIVEKESVLYDRRISNDKDFIMYSTVSRVCFEPSVLWWVAKNVPGSLEKMKYCAKLLVNIDVCEMDTLLTCEFCGYAYRNVIIHALVNCHLTKPQRDSMWNFVCNYCPVEIQAELHSLDDAAFACALLGRNLVNNYLWSEDCYMLLLYRFACYVFSTSYLITVLLTKQEDNYSISF